MIISTTICCATVKDARDVEEEEAVQGLQAVLCFIVAGSDDTSPRGSQMILDDEVRNENGDLSSLCPRLHDPSNFRRGLTDPSKVFRKCLQFPAQGWRKQIKLECI